MSVTTAVLVGDAKKWIPDIVEYARQLKVTAGISIWKTHFNEISWLRLFQMITYWQRNRLAGCVEGCNFGPLISKASKERCVELIESARKDGCQILLDGSKYVPKGYENGYFVGATVINGVKENMRCYQVMYSGTHTPTHVHSLNYAVAVRQYWIQIELLQHTWILGRNFRSCLVVDGSR